MATAFINAFGVLAGALGIIQLGLDNFGDQSEQPAAVIRIHVGLESDATGITNAGGDLPDARTFNVGGEFLGITADPRTVGDGSFEEFKVEQDDN